MIYQPIAWQSAHFVSDRGKSTSQNWQTPFGGALNCAQTQFSKRRRSAFIWARKVRIPELVSEMPA